jgi:hypothetical protein
MCRSYEAFSRRTRRLLGDYDIPYSQPPEPEASGGQGSASESALGSSLITLSPMRTYRDANTAIRRAPIESERPTRYCATQSADIQQAESKHSSHLPTIH